MRFLLITLILTSVLWADVKFYRETVNILINDSAGVVDGRYYLKNTSHGKKIPLIFFPFPLDENHPYPYDIGVEGHNYQVCDSGIAIVIPFEPQEKKVLRIHYEQKIKDRTYVYVVKTVRDWKQLLEEAKFVISLPSSFDGLELNYKANQVMKDSLHQIYTIYRKNFYPKEDLKIKWR